MEKKTQKELPYWLNSYVTLIYINHSGEVESSNHAQYRSLVQIISVTGTVPLSTGTLKQLEPLK